MTLREAERMCAKFTDSSEVSAKVVRILPSDIDPITPMDNGWDVEFEVLEDES